MSTENKILIKDSCILFDLLDLNLLNSFFQLHYTVLSTPHVIDEIKNENQLNEVNKHISNGNLVIDTNSSLETIQMIVDEHPGLSFADSSILELAIRENGIILTSDKGLCNASKRRDVIAYGILWILEELIRGDVITIDLALEKLNVYPTINQRAPKKEITLLINKLERALLNK